jgi:hypothetical protein
VESPEQVWLYRAIGTCWNKLADIGEAKIAHSLTQSLEMFISVDSEAIFLRVGAILRASKAWGISVRAVGIRLGASHLHDLFGGIPGAVSAESRMLEDHA